MDMSQLKSLAVRVRAVLRENSVDIGHNQALDLIAALPGLRNWPEVIAFPERVAACDVDAASAGRLAFRLNKKHGLDLMSNQVLSALACAPSTPGLQVWPGGPPSGVYVTTSPSAIRALLERYEEATDGGLVYAEDAGKDWDGRIDLGEDGLWSSGIDRLASGTLIVVGPVNLDQGAWDDAAQRLTIACIHALDSGHRVAVLFDTPTPNMLGEDLMVLLRPSTDKHPDVCTALTGVVAEDGELLTRRPFARAYPAPVVTQAEASLETFPDSVRELLKRELAQVNSGIVVFGSSEFATQTVDEQVAAGLAMTGHGGPAARIMSRHRSTPSKDWVVPEAIRAIPFLPSIESAYAQGYRRMVIDLHYCRAEALMAFDDVLFLGSTYGHDATHNVMTVAAGGYRAAAAIVERVVAAVGLLVVPSRRGRVIAGDLFVRRLARGTGGTAFEDVEAFVKDNRVVRWETELASLLDAKRVTESGVKRTRPNHVVMDFLASRRAGRKA